MNLTTFCCVTTFVSITLQYANEDYCRRREDFNEWLAKQPTLAENYSKRRNDLKEIDYVRVPSQRNICK